MSIEIWGQDSAVKGVRLIRFERRPDRRLTWLGPVGESDKQHQFPYAEEELRANKWEKIE